MKYSYWIDKLHSIQIMYQLRTLLFAHFVSQWSILFDCVCSRVQSCFPWSGKVPFSTWSCICKVNCCWDQQMTCTAHELSSTAQSGSLSLRTQRAAASSWVDCSPSCCWPGLLSWCLFSIPNTEPNLKVYVWRWLTLPGFPLEAVFLCVYCQTSKRCWEIYQVISKCQAIVGTTRGKETTHCHLCNSKILLYVFSCFFLKLK